MDQLLLKIMHDIEKEPYADWSLERAAEVAGYSPFHFHRMFKAATGYTLFRFVRGCQMHAAAKLVVRAERVEEIADRLNYSSPGAFSRSFKSFTGVSPTEFRENPVAVLLQREFGSDPIRIAGGATMQGKTIELSEAITVIGVQVKTNPPADMNISVAWKGLSERWNAIGAGGAARTFGLEEYAAEGRARVAGILYTACVEADADAVPPAGAIQRTIPAGRYAVFTHTGPTETLDQTFRYIYLEGLEALGVTPAADFDLEVYDERCKEGDPRSQLDIYVPVAA